MCVIFDINICTCFNEQLGDGVVTVLSCYRKDNFNRFERLEQRKAEKKSETLRAFAWRDIFTQEKRCVVRVLVGVDFVLDKKEFDNLFATGLCRNDERCRAFDVTFVEERRAALFQNQLDQIERAKLGSLVQSRALFASRRLNSDISTFLYFF